MRRNSSKSVDHFFNTDGSLIQIPARSSKKIQVLNRIAMSLETNHRYSEKELNELLAKFHFDTASLRRYMIEFGIMDRDNSSNYWLKLEK